MQESEREGQELGDPGDCLVPGEEPMVGAKGLEPLTSWV